MRHSKIGHGLIWVKCTSTIWKLTTHNIYTVYCKFVINCRFKLWYEKMRRQFFLLLCDLQFVDLIKFYTENLCRQWNLSSRYRNHFMKSFCDQNIKTLHVWNIIRINIRIKERSILPSHKENVSDGLNHLLQREFVA